MNWLDIVLGVSLVYAAIKGFKNGVFVEIASIAALVIGVWIAIKFSGLTETWITEKLKWDPNHIELIAFIITFVLVVILIHIVAKLVDQFFKAIALGIFTRLSGLVVGLVKTAFILSIVLFIIEKVELYSFDIIPARIKSQSVLYRPIKSFAPNILPLFYKKEREDNDGKAFSMNDSIYLHGSF